MPKRLPTVSVVIPVFNEEKLLRQCLEALKNQSVKPHEIIIVDNNCTDKSIEIARSFKAKIVKEKRQGISYARTTGFNHATGDIISRMDADTMASPEWIGHIQQVFAANKNLVGLCGPLGVQELSPPTKHWFTGINRIYRLWHERRIGIRPIMYGCNMAIGRASWHKIEPAINLDDSKISEDIDISILANKHGKVLYDPKLKVNTHLIRFMRPEKIRRYYNIDGYTIALHKRLGNL